MRNNQLVLSWLDVWVNSLSCTISLEFHHGMYKCEGYLVIPSEQVDFRIFFPFCWALPGIQLARRRSRCWGRGEKAHTWRQHIKRTCVSYSLEIDFIESTCLGFNNLSLLPQLGDIYFINLDAYVLQSGTHLFKFFFWYW